MLFDLLGLGGFNKPVHFGLNLSRRHRCGFTSGRHQRVEGGTLNALFLNDGFLGLSTCVTGLGLELVFVLRLGSSGDVRIVAGHDGGTFTGSPHLVRLEGGKGFDVCAIFLEVGFPMDANLLTADTTVEGARTTFKGHLRAVVEHQTERNVAFKIGLEVKAGRCVTLGGDGAEATKVGVFVGVTDAHQATWNQMGDADDFFGLHHATGRHHARTAQHVGLVFGARTTHERRFCRHQLWGRLFSASKHAAPEETAADDGGHGEQSPVPRGQPCHEKDGHGTDTDQHEGDVAFSKCVRH